MEIRYLTQKEKAVSRILYEEVFVEDDETFVDAYYKIKAADNQILGAIETGNFLAMLHRNPYTFRFRGKCVRADYLVAVATRRPFRHRGIMRRLLTRALEDMAEEQQPFAFLMPADEAIYLPFDFRLMGNEDEEGLAALSGEELAEEYDLYVEKDGDYERRHISWPEWEATPMMIRPVYLPAFVEQIGAKEPQRLVIAVKDPILSGNQGTFSWEFTAEGSCLIPCEEPPEFTIAIGELGSFLCGMVGAEELLKQEELPGAEKTSESKEASEAKETSEVKETPEMEAARKRKVLEEKLNRIQVLEGIYINETV